MKFILQPEFEEMKLLEKTKIQYTKNNLISNNYQRKENKRIKNYDNLNIQFLKNEKTPNFIETPAKSNKFWLYF